MLNLQMDVAFFKITALGAAIGVGMNLIMVNYWGYIGTALNWLIVETYITGAMYLFLRKQSINPIDIKLFNPVTLITVLKPYLKIKYKS